jgi:hypothetical protein
MLFGLRLRISLGLRLIVRGCLFCFVVFLLGASLAATATTERFFATPGTPDTTNITEASVRAEITQMQLFRKALGQPKKCTKGAQHGDDNPIAGRCAKLVSSPTSWKSSEPAVRKCFAEFVPPLEDHRCNLKQH